MSNIQLLNISDIDNYSKNIFNSTDFSKNDLISKKLVVNQSQPIHCKQPIFHNPNDEMFFFGKPKELFNYYYPFYPISIINFDYCTLISDIYALITHDNYVIKDSYLNDSIFSNKPEFLRNSIRINLENNFTNVDFFLHKKYQNVDFIDEECFLLPYYWHFNYHHWLIECLARIKYLNDFDRQKKLKVIVPNNMSNFQKDSLKLFDIPEENLIYMNKNYRFKKLYFPSLGNFSPDEIFWLRNHIFSKLNIIPRAEKKYYISRNDANQRRLSNEKEIIEILINQGFEILELSKISFEEQVKIFSQAKIIIAPHGAGMTNMIFSPSECTMIELAPNDQVNHCFWLLANVINLKYYFLTGQKISQERDFIINKNIIENILKDII
jgi:hypothetical protein